MRKRALSLFAVVIAVTLAGCEPGGEFRLAPVGGGGSSGVSRFSDWWQGKTPTTPVQPQTAPTQPITTLPATGLAANEARRNSNKRYPPAREEDFQEIAGVKEFHHAKDPKECTRLFLWFFEHKIRLNRMEIKSNPMPGNKKQSVCVYFGTDAQVQRFGYNDYYDLSGTPYPKSVNEYPPNPKSYDPLNKPSPTYREDAPLSEYQRSLPPSAADEIPFTDEDAARLDNLAKPTPNPSFSP